jgi:transposase-like protein
MAMELFSTKLRARLLAHAQRRTLREIARRTEIDVSQLSRFANDAENGKLGQDAIDRLERYLRWKRAERFPPSQSPNYRESE